MTGGATGIGAAAVEVLSSAGARGGDVSLDATARRRRGVVGAVDVRDAVAVDDMVAPLPPSRWAAEKVSAIALAAPCRRREPTG